MFVCSGGSVWGTVGRSKNSTGPDVVVLISVVRDFCERLSPVLYSQFSRIRQIAAAR